VSDPFVAEIRLFAGNFAPTGWAFCSGQILPISQNTALFSLLGTNYGGNGTSTFGLPNLQGAFPIGQGQGVGLTNRNVGDTGGTANVTLQSNEGAVHSHAAVASTNPATTGNPSGAVLATTPASNPIYVGSPGEVLTMGPLAVGAASAPAAVPHNNLQPYVAVSFIIALEGIYPPRS
jgi:microcystin-dependent protein